PAGRRIGRHAAPSLRLHLRSAVGPTPGPHAARGRPVDVTAGAARGGAAPAASHTSSAGDVPRVRLVRGTRAGWTPVENPSEGRGAKRETDRRGGEPGLPARSRGGAAAPRSPGCRAHATRRGRGHGAARARARASTRAA